MQEDIFFEVLTLDFSEVANDGKELAISSVNLNDIHGISSIRLFLPKQLSATERNQCFKRQVREVFSRFPDGLPFLDPIEDMKIRDSRLKILVEVSPRSSQTI